MNSEIIESACTPSAIADKLDIIINLLSQLIHSQVNEPMNEPSTTSALHLNKSKFVNDTQREQILTFIKQPTVISSIKSLPKHKQASKLQSMIKQQLNIDVSYYMATRLAASLRETTTNDSRSEAFGQSPNDDNE